MENFTWRLIEQQLSTSVEQALAEETNLLKQAAISGKAIARIWENPKSIIVTRKERRLPDFTRACELMQQQGWPVYVRDTGGTAVPHYPGILHLSLFIPKSLATPTLDDIYLLLCNKLQLLLAQFDVPSGFDFVDNSFCDGKYNLVVNHKKITGTAQKWLAPTQSQQGAILAQAMLMVEGDIYQGTKAVNQFYQLAGSDIVFDPSVSTSLLQELNEPRDLLTSQVRNQLARLFS